jgi:hypothetical protein
VMKKMWKEERPVNRRGSHLQCGTTAKHANIPCPDIVDSCAKITPP